MMNMMNKNMMNKNMINKFIYHNSLLGVEGWLFYNSFYNLREFSTTRLLYSDNSSDETSNSSSTPSTNPDLTEHEQFSAEYPDNLYNRPVDEVPTKYIPQYKTALIGVINAISGEGENDEAFREKMEERLKDFEEELERRPPLTERDFSPDPSSGTEDTLTDRISRVVDLNSPGSEQANPIEEKKRKSEQEAEDSIDEPEAKRFKQDSSDITEDSSSPQFGDVIEGGKTYIKEDFQKESGDTSSKDGEPSANQESKEGSNEQEAKYFKQDSSDVTSDGEITDLFDLDGGE